MQSKKKPGLRLDAGYASLTGPRERNEDYCGIAQPDGLELENKGAVAAVADGIGGHKGGAKRRNMSFAVSWPTTLPPRIPGLCRAPSKR